ncbi:MULTISPECIES: VOC family protein [unclassified Corynebacterium]|uniref:VOC family protein n=1 Tax=Corynebacterium TaxID=1716 RepID=UPI00254FC53A|nr:MULTISPECIES: VOC family protein [unclassified Corynebacterium]MDK8468143.1 VOC family protein [Corynebacterium sp. MSK130]MDK8477088.1 VOC family protein [Corynebacterium sp. MSK310]MDK8492490.1 VOC family protein [Corynebacterium sp. MSK175]MDK8647808.1 VOC family protein [Corynebacterium sp. MSK082]MDK8673532.1 VOC family protein [Corynebacterium sp. MSK189]
MPAFEAEVGMPYWIDLTTSDPRKSAHFYEQVLGWEISAETQEDNPYQMARLQGLPIAGLIPQPEEAPMPDTWVTYFLSKDIDGDCQRTENLGGRILASPQPVQLGHMALLADAAGGMFGLIQPSGPEHFVAGGEPGTPVWHELTATTRFQQAMDFYGELFNWEIRAMESEDENFIYATAEEDGAPFAGLWNAEGQFPPQVPSFWQTYLGVRDIDAAAEKAVELGGEIIREPWDSPFGRMCLLADSTGATITLTEVEDAPEDEPTESDDVLNPTRD